MIFKVIIFTVSVDSPFYRKEENAKVNKVHLLAKVNERTITGTQLYNCEQFKRKKTSNYYYHHHRNGRTCADSLMFWIELIKVQRNYTQKFVSKTHTHTHAQVKIKNKNIKNDFSTLCCLNSTRGKIKEMTIDGQRDQSG